MVFSNEMTANFIKLLNEIKQIPEDVLSQDLVRMFKQEIDGFKIESSEKKDLVETLKKSDFDKSDVEEFKAEINLFFNESIEEAEFTEGSLAFEMAHYVKIKFLDELDKILEKFCACDCEVYFQLLHKNAKLPAYAHEGDSGADVFIPEDVVIPPLARGFLVPTGFAMAIPKGWEMQVRPRSGLSKNTTMRIPNSPGTLDSNYRDEVGILIDNLSDEPIALAKGDRIAQFVICPSYHFKATTVNDVRDFGEDRGGGFGFTGR